VTGSDAIRTQGTEERIPSAPKGGEGGSVLRDLGSDGVKAARREEKKRLYEEYLRSPEWKAIRRKVLARDQHRCRASGCERRATVVHHARYPHVLGREHLSWLYSLCAPCHDEIHRRHRKPVTLREATRQVLALPPTPPRRPKKKRKGPKVRKTQEQQLRQLKAHLEAPTRGRPIATLRQVEKFATNLRARQSGGKMAKLIAENERMHEIQKRSRERRARREE